MNIRNHIFILNFSAKGAAWVLTILQSLEKGCAMAGSPRPRIETLRPNHITGGHGASDAYRRYRNLRLR